MTLPVMLNRTSIIMYIISQQIYDDYEEPMKNVFRVYDDE